MCCAKTRSLGRWSHLVTSSSRSFLLNTIYRSIKSRKEIHCSWLLPKKYLFFLSKYHQSRWQVPDDMPPKLPRGPPRPTSKISDYARPILSYSVPSQAPTSKPRSSLPVGPWGVPTGREKIIVVGSEWYFKPDGAAKVRKKFLEQLEKQGLRGVSDSLFLFCLHCYISQRYNIALGGAWVAGASSTSPLPPFSFCEANSDIRY